MPKATQVLTAEPGLRPEAPVSQSRAGAAVTGRDLSTEDHSLPTHVPAPGPVPSREVSQQRSVSRKPVGDAPAAGPGQSVTTAIYSMSSVSSAIWSNHGKKATPRLESGPEMQNQPSPAEGEWVLLTFPADLRVLAERGGRR